MLTDLQHLRKNLQSNKKVLSRPGKALLNNRVSGSASHAQLDVPTPCLDLEPGFQLPAGGIELESLEKDLIRQALEQANGNKTQAAALLGLTRDTLRYRIDKYGLKSGTG